MEDSIWWLQEESPLAGQMSHLSREWGKQIRELREGVVEGADGIGKSGGDGIRAEEQTRLRWRARWMDRGRDAGDRLDEQAVDAIHLGFEAAWAALEIGSCGLRSFLRSPANTAV